MSERLPKTTHDEETNMSTELSVRQGAAELEIMAQNIAESRLFGLDKAQAFALMLLAESEGLHPIQALRRYHIIDGKPAMRADAMHAEFQRRGGKVRWLMTTAEECAAEFSHPIHQPDPIEMKVTFAEMEKAGVTHGKFGLKDNWKKWPAAMLRARVISAGVRMVDPGVVVGIYTPEEIGDFTPIETTGHVVEPTDDTSTSHHAKHHNNDTGHGSGAYADPQVVAEFQRWCKDFTEEINAKWLDSLTDKTTGEIVKGAGEIVNPFQLANHLIKWGAQGGRSLGQMRTNSCLPPLQFGELGLVPAQVFQQSASES